MPKKHTKTVDSLSRRVAIIQKQYVMQAIQPIIFFFQIMAADAERRLICSFSDCGAHGPSVKKGQWARDGDLKIVYIEVATRQKGHLYAGFGTGKTTTRSQSCHIHLLRTRHHKKYFFLYRFLLLCSKLQLTESNSIYFSKNNKSLKYRHDVDRVFMIV